MKEGGFLPPPLVLPRHLMPLVSLIPLTEPHSDKADVVNVSNAVRASLDQPSYSVEISTVQEGIGHDAPQW